MQEDMLTWIEGQTQELAAPTILAQLMRLRQIAGSLEIFLDPADIKGDNSAKIDAFMDIVDGTDGKIVVFSCFKKMLLAAQRRLDKAKITSCLCTGDVSLKDRNQMMLDFQNSVNPRVFLATIDVAGVGLTLTAASTEFFFDKKWTPAENEQAEDRCHRIGQESSVLIYSCVAKDTVDTLHIEPLLLNRREMVRLILGQED
jgi:SWI/SNF-related matrix-associated actin-dependent regulator 1 of chromatin subfamily A